jgi:hypothetical protein
MISKQFDGLWLPLSLHKIRHEHPLNAQSWCTVSPINYLIDILLPHFLTIFCLNLVLVSSTWPKIHAEFFVKLIRMCSNFQKMLNDKNVGIFLKFVKSLNYLFEFWWDYQDYFCILRHNDIRQSCSCIPKSHKYRLYKD